MARSVVGYAIDLPRRWVALAALAGATLGYTAAVDPVVHSTDQVVYPAVWIAASVTALWTVPADLWRTPGRRTLALGGAYAVVLMWIAGLIQPPAGPSGVSVHLGIPGWSPSLVATTPILTVTVVPFLVFGYATLGVLAALAMRHTWHATVPGAVGLFACVSCTAPLLAAVAGALGAGSIAASLARAQYPVATVIFLLSVGGLTLIVRRSAHSCQSPS